MDIKRYDFAGNIITGEAHRHWCNEGEYVTYADHKAEIDELVDLLENVQAFTNPAVRLQAELTIAKHKEKE